MRLIVVRHGLTVDNGSGRYQGHRPGKLSEAGIKQVRELAMRLKDAPIDIIYTSDLTRARETADEVAKYHPDAPLVPVRELRERCYGVFEGRPYKETGYDFSDRWSVEHESVETPEQMNARVSSFLDRTLRQHEDKTVLCVGHGGSIESLLSILFKKPIRQIYKEIEIVNNSISVFVINMDGSFRVELLNNVSGKSHTLSRGFPSGVG
jgi:broad specificity phosphatase PhoE